MKYLIMTFTLASFLLCTNMVIAQGQRTVANPGVNIEVRSVEDILKNSDDFVSVTPGSNARKMTSNSSNDKNNSGASQVAGITTNQDQVNESEAVSEQAQTDNNNVMKKFKRFSDKEGEKKKIKGG